MPFFSKKATPAPTTPPPTDRTTASVSDVISTINHDLREAGGQYAEYSCKTVSWDDVTRGEVGGSLSCWGGNITDTRLYAKSGQQLYTVRTNNFNEKLGRVSAHDLALITGNQQTGGVLTPATLADVLKNFSKHAQYAGLDEAVDLSDVDADEKVSVRFMTTFLPVADEQLATLQFCPEVYQYQTRTAKDPANLLLLATSQGFAVQANGSGATKLYHHAVEPSGKIARYWFEAERSEKKVGGAQQESKEEALAAASRGKATAAVIGTRSMGTRFNVLMTVQVPLKQKPRARRGTCGMAGIDNEMDDWGFMLDEDEEMMGGMMGGCAPLMMGGCAPGCAPLSTPAYAKACMSLSSEEEGDEDDLAASMSDWEEDDLADVMGKLPSAPYADMMKSCEGLGRGARCEPPQRSRVGKANAARVSRGTMVDRVDKTVEVKAPVRDPSQHVTVTVVIYNTVAGGVPSAEDVKAAVADMESLYASCGWSGKLADGGASFMKKELTVQNVADISDKLAQQPYVPPTGAIGLVVGGDVFPTSANTKSAPGAQKTALTAEEKELAELEASMAM